MAPEVGPQPTIPDSTGPVLNDPDLSPPANVNALLLAVSEMWDSWRVSSPPPAELDGLYRTWTQGGTTTATLTVTGNAAVLHVVYSGPFSYDADVAVADLPPVG